MKTKLRAWGLSLGCLLLVSLYPCLFQYSTNLPESRFSDAAVFWGIFAGIGLIAFCVCLLILRRVEAAGFLGTLCLLAGMNFGLLKSGVQKLLPWLPGSILLGGCALVLLILGILLLVKKWSCHVPLVMVTLMFGVLCLISGVLAVPELVKSSKQPPEPEHVPVLSRQEAEMEQPNVYLFLYDEYSGPEGLEYFYQFDNSPFYDALSQRGFNCSMDSYNTESCATTTLVPDLYAMSYDAAPFVSGDGNMPNLYQVFKKLGYQINLISHNDFLDTDGARVLTKGQTADSICQYLYQNSLLPFTPLAGVMERQMPQLRATYQFKQLLDEALDTIDNAWRETADGPTLTLGYVQCPHAGFVYDKDGGRVPEEDFLNWRDPQYYLGQLQYVNGRILKTVDNILEHDPSAVIILQSDHGARLGYHLIDLYGDDYDPETETIHQQNILNCVYLGGETLDISGLSGINTLRTVLNRLYGMDYDMLEPRTFVNYYP